MAWRLILLSVVFGFTGGMSACALFPSKSVQAPPALVQVVEVAVSPEVQDCIVGMGQLMEEMRRRPDPRAVLAFCVAFVAAEKLTPKGTVQT